MSEGLLLDTHTAVWWRSHGLLSPTALDRITEAQRSQSLYLSPISVWELVYASQKANMARRPNLGGLTPEAWFESAIRQTGALTTEFTASIAAAAAAVVEPYGSGDLGDCFLLATAYALKLTLVTRDVRILAFAKANPDYLTTIRC